MDDLALLGGRPLLDIPPPHCNPTAFTQDDRRAITHYLERDDATMSYYGRSGIVAEYETDLADYFRRRHCLLMNSGTSALHSAFFGLGFEPGDEVIAPVHTFKATVTPLISLGVVPVLADCDVTTGNLDPWDVRQKITDRTKGVVVTHQWGHPAEMDSIMKISREHGLRVVEDLSLAFGATYKGRKVGSFGDVGAFSLGPTKMLSGGEGGALVTDDTEVADRALLLGHFLRSESEVITPKYAKYRDTGFGHNYRMHVLAVAVSRSRFARFAELQQARHERFELLTSLLGGLGVVRPPVTGSHVRRGQWGGYMATYEADGSEVPLDLFGRALAAEGLDVRPRGYHPLLHLTGWFTDKDDLFFKSRRFPENKRTYERGDFPNAERLIDQTIAFPLFLDEPIALVEKYGLAVQKVVANLSSLREFNLRSTP